MTLPSQGTGGVSYTLSLHRVDKPTVVTGLGNTLPLVHLPVHVLRPATRGRGVVVGPHLRILRDLGFTRTQRRTRKSEL